MIKNVSVKLFNFSNGGCCADQESVCQTLQFLQWKEYLWSRVCQTLQLHLWREYWWSRTCLSNSSAPSIESVLVIKNVSVKPFSFSNGRCIGVKNVSVKLFSFFEGYIHDQVKTWSCLSNSSASSMEGVLVIKNVSVKSSASLMDGIFVIKNVSVKLSSFINGWYIRDQDRVCQTFFSIFMIKNVSVKLFNFFNVEVIDDQERVKLFNFSNGGCCADQESVCQTLQFLQWKEYLWSRTCLSNSSASFMEGVLVIKNVPL